jgi:Rieske 2Fe-2S family protein
MTAAPAGAATRRVPANAWTLPARYYCDPAVFELEGERIHRALWTAACPVEELAAPGDYRLVEIAGDSLIVVRGEDGRVRAHHNVCRHRGTRLLEAEAGCLAGSIQCPYHAWTYGLDGRLRRAPHMDEVEAFSVSDFPLAEAACEEWSGIVWVRVSEKGPGLAEQMGPTGSRIGIWGLENLRSAHTVSYEVRANWKLIIQNFAECLHCPVIHPQLARLSHYLSGENYPADPNAIGAAMDLEKGVETLSSDGRLVGIPLPGLPERFRRRVGYEILLPNALLCLHPDFVVRYLMRPVEVGHTSIRCDWLFSGETLASEGFDASRAVEFWDETNRQDWRVSELSQQGIGSSAYRQGPYSNREDHLWQIDRLILERLGDA